MLECLPAVFIASVLWRWSQDTQWHFRNLFFYILNVSNHGNNHFDNLKYDNSQNKSNALRITLGSAIKLEILNDDTLYNNHYGRAMELKKS